MQVHPEGVVVLAWLSADMRWVGFLALLRRPLWLRMGTLRFRRPPLPGVEAERDPGFEPRRRRETTTIFPTDQDNTCHPRESGDLAVGTQRSVKCGARRRALQCRDVLDARVREHDNVSVQGAHSQRPAHPRHITISWR